MEQKYAFKDYKHWIGWFIMSLGLVIITYFWILIGIMQISYTMLILLGIAWFFAIAITDSVLHYFGLHG